jgi:4-diphosphocytidyl-2-C-methyl-D-erythritol kinase
MDSTLRLLAPAKVNLTLDVISRRPDGYHELQMIMLALGLADELTFTPSQNLQLACSEPSLPVDEGNLVVRAARLFEEATGVEAKVRIELTKNVPLSAGLGGGSSDAATTLKGLDRLYKTGLTTDRLEALGAGLGADVPFFIRPGHKIARGVGEKLFPFELEQPLFLVLVNPGFPVSTAETYQKLQLTSPRKQNRLPASLPGETPLCGLLRNDLEPVVLRDYPEVATIKRFLNEAGCEGCLMSGSGPTVFGIYRDAMTSEAVAKAATEHGWSAWPTVTRALWD